MIPDADTDGSRPSYQINSQIHSQNINLLRKYQTDEFIALQLQFSSKFKDCGMCQVIFSPNCAHVLQCGGVTPFHHKDFCCR